MSAAVPDFMLEAATPAMAAAPRDEDPLDGEFIAANDAPDLRGPAPEFVPGCFDSMPAETYHRIEAVGSGGAKALLQSGSHYKLMRTQEGKSTPTLLFGQALHIATLEPDTYDARVVVEPVVNKRTNVGKATIAAFYAANRGKIIITPDQRDRARRCGDAIRAHPAATALLRGAVTERSLFWYDGKYKVPCKARLDVWNLSIASDVKSTTDASREAFARAIHTYGYAVQAAHYISGCEHVLNESPQAFVFIAVESEAPHCVGVYQLDIADILYGRGRCDLALERYVEIMNTGKYLGYSNRIETISMPAYARRVTQ